MLFGKQPAYIYLHCNAHGLSIFIIVDYAQLFQGAISHVAHVTETGEIVALVESHILDPQQENIDPQVKLKLFVCLTIQPFRYWKACLYRFSLNARNVSTFTVFSLSS